ncbi:MAG: hypothetical protein A3B68_02675 [Candidatus Melainabacteria bacterium RIFCSPHIGHO2_02_FULL_34_12]|nr:MAG: hypothetical protein A3B68_02675 [Candidatus Melainabacteria bacterium RIFCSPHIGHO2_02_FULL_34_12]
MHNKFQNISIFISTFIFVVLIAQLPQNDLLESNNDNSSNTELKVSKDNCLNSCLNDVEKIAKCDSKDIIENFLIEDIFKK